AAIAAWNRPWETAAIGRAASASRPSGSAASWCPPALRPALTPPGTGDTACRRDREARGTMADPTLLILPGDGIGPEVMAEVRKVIAWFGANRGLRFAIEEDLVGGCSYDAHGTPLTDAAMARAQAADAVLLGAVGGPQYDELDFSL